MIETVDIVLAALGAGAAAGVSNTASKVVVEAYDGLKSAVRTALRRANPRTDDSNPQAEAMLDAQLAEPGRHREALAAALTAAEVDRDEELLDAARRLLNLTTAPQYGNHVHDNKGVQVGNGNSMSIDLRSM